MLPFLDDFQSPNFGSEPNAINSFSKSVALANNHFGDDDSVDVCDHEWPSASSNLLASHEDFTLDL